MNATAHSKKRQRERGISDNEIEQAVDHGVSQPTLNNRRLHVGGGIAVVTTESNVAVTAWRSDKTCHPTDAVVVHRVCNYGESSASDVDEGTRTRTCSGAVVRMAITGKPGQAASGVTFGRAAAAECERLVKRMDVCHVQT